jgi:hypothetical protein
MLRPGKWLSSLNEKEALPLARYAAEVPQELERIVAKLLRKNRDERYQTSKDVLVDLRHLKEELEFERKRKLSAAFDQDTGSGSGAA